MDIDDKFKPFLSFYEELNNDILMSTLLHESGDELGDAPVEKEPAPAELDNLLGFADDEIEAGPIEDETYKTDMVPLPHRRYIFYFESSYGSVIELDGVAIQAMKELIFDPKSYHRLETLEKENRLIEGAYGIVELKSLRELQHRGMIIVANELAEISDLTLAGTFSAREMRIISGINKGNVYGSKLFSDGPEVSRRKTKLYDLMADYRECHIKGIKIRLRGDHDWNEIVDGMGDKDFAVENTSFGGIIAKKQGYKILYDTSYNLAAVVDLDQKKVDIYHISKTKGGLSRLTKAIETKPVYYDGSFKSALREFSVKRFKMDLYSNNWSPEVNRRQGNLVQKSIKLAELIRYAITN